MRSQTRLFMNTHLQSYKKKKKNMQYKKSKLPSIHIWTCLDCICSAYLNYRLYTAFNVVRVINERQQYHSTEKKCMKDRGNGGDKGTDDTVGTLATSSSSTTTLLTVSSITNFCSNPYSIPLLT